MTSSGFRKGLPAAFLLLVMLVQFTAALANAADASDIRNSCRASGSRSEDLVGIIRTKAVVLRQPGILHRRRAGTASLRHCPGYILPDICFQGGVREAVHLLVINRNGSVRQTAIPAAALPSSMAGGYFRVSLPEVTREDQQVVAAIDMPSHRMTLERAYLTATDEVDGIGNMRFLLILAGLAGMLIMPLIFNAAFYRALREPFVLWHSALTFSLLTTILVSSGLSVVLSMLLR